VANVFLVAKLAGPFPVPLLLGGVRPISIIVNVQCNFLIADFQFPVRAEFLAFLLEGAFQRIGIAAARSARRPVVTRKGHHGRIPLSGSIARRMSDAIVVSILWAIEAVAHRN
jgi:hypothetical protein